MKAAIVDRIGTIALENVPTPPAGAGEIRVAIEACGLCGSDLHAYRARSWSPNLIPGHEIAGRIESIGPDAPTVVQARQLGIGDRVVVEPLETCRACEACDAGRDSICPELQIAGVHRAGGFAESISLPAERIHPIAPEIEPAVATLCEPIAVALHALDRGAFLPGERVLVLGGGALGILTTFVAQTMGAGEVVVRARYAHQRDRVRAIADAATAVDTESSLMDQGLESGFDLVIETVGGLSGTLTEAIRAARPGGRVVVLGLFDENPPFEPNRALAKELSFHWSNCYHTRNGLRSDFARATALLVDHHPKLRQLITHKLPLEEITRAFAIANDKREGVGKLVVIACPTAGLSEEA